MNQEIDIFEDLDLEKNIFLEDIPHIDLYMDQVIQLFEKTFGPTKRNDDEKILTKTMINNYAKGKLMIPIKNKKYSREHLILLSLIYQLKSGLSINDIKTILEGINKKVVNDEKFSLEEFYKSYLHLHMKNANETKADFETKIQDVMEVVGSSNNEDSEYVEKVLLIISLITTSLFYRKAAEKLVDELLPTDTAKKDK